MKEREVKQRRTPGRTNATILRTTLAALAALVVGVPALAQDIPAAATQEAQTVWQTRCTTCHGAAGKGDGAAAVALTPKPRDLSLATWQASVTDAHLEKIIAEGGQAVGLSMLMPANPDLVAKPDVIKALRVHVRSLAAK